MDSRTSVARRNRVVIIGAGIGGLACAVELARVGIDVTVVESGVRPGGKLAELRLGGFRLDVGPTVFTMRWVFDEIFATAGANLDAFVTLRPTELLARHRWPDGSALDLYADIERSAHAVAEFAGGREAAGYRAFCEESGRLYDSLRETFIDAQQTGFAGFVSRLAARGPAAMLGLRPFETLWSALGDHFQDPRLRQLYGRYATYCGSSPFFAPATLMLIAHVERQGVWTVDGGMGRLADALEALARAKGARFRYATTASSIEIGDGGVRGVRLADGDLLEAEAVVANGDVRALTHGLLGPAVANAVEARSRGEPSLSALTWALAASTRGVPLARHNVFFSSDYAAEFADIRSGAPPFGPTVYVCAQDRDDGGQDPAGAERLLMIVNAPANGDGRAMDQTELSECEDRVFNHLARCGLELARQPELCRMTTPTMFAGRFPGTGGALYGTATHGWDAAFRRAGARSRIPGLYLAGGSVHPGPGVPMAALSGRLAARRFLADRGSTASSRPVAMSGGTSTR